MATVDATGITPRDVSGYRDLFQTRFRNAFGQDMAFDDETPQSQWIGVASLALAEMDEIVVADANGMAPSKGSGFQLDNLFALINVLRLAQARSVVTASLTGVAGTIIPAGSQARTTAGAVFRSRAAVTLTGTGDTVVMESADFGAIAAAAGTLTEIVTAVSGWTAVTNAADAVLGRLRESDSAYRIRYDSLTSRLAAGFPAAIRARILEVPGVVRALVHDNDTNADVTEQMLVIPAHGILAIVQGGADADVAEAIRLSKAGAATGGAVTVAGISFQRVTVTAVALAFETTVGANFPADGLADLRTAVAEFAAANWTVGGGIDLRALVAPIYSVPGHVLTGNPTATLQAGGQLPATPNLNVLYTLAATDITITTT